MYEFAPALITCACLWYGIAADMARKGRGWYFRNVVAGTNGLFFGLLVFAAMITGGRWQWAGLAGAGLSVAAVVGQWQKRPTAPRQP
jgi:hypothetical protein